MKGRTKGIFERAEESNLWWRMRASKSDKSNISRLAESLGMKESDAVRYAVAFALNSGLTKRAADGAKSFVEKELVGYSPRR
jgi:hypothetical protein